MTIKTKRTKKVKAWAVRTERFERMNEWVASEIFIHSNGAVAFATPQEARSVANGRKVIQVLITPVPRTK